MFFLLVCYFFAYARERSFVFAVFLIERSRTNLKGLHVRFASV
jgi:hypothetical protein